MVTLPFKQELMNGVGESKDMVFRRATEADIDAVYKLQEEIVDALPDKDMYATSTKDEYLVQLKEDICFVCECDGEFAGFSVLVPNDAENERNYGKYFNYDKEQLAVTASFDLTMVSPRFRGYGIQRDFNKLRAGVAVEMGAKEALTSISPDNPYSYRNFLVLNFEIVEERKMYGGKARYLLRKEF